MLNLMSEQEKEGKEEESENKEMVRSQPMTYKNMLK